MRVRIGPIIITLVISSLAFGKPNGGEIAGKAKSAKLDKGKSTKAKNKKGKSMTFTPVEHGKVKVSAQEAGHVIGVIDSQFPVSPAKLPPGTYNIYGAKVDGQWRAFYEQKGKVVAEAKLSVTKKSGKGGKAAFKNKGKGKGEKGKGNGKGNKKSFLGDEQPDAIDEYSFDDEGWYDLEESMCWEDADTGDVYCDDLYGVLCNTYEDEGCLEYVENQ